MLYLYSPTNYLVLLPRSFCFERLSQRRTDHLAGRSVPVLAAATPADGRGPHKEEEGRASEEHLHHTRL